MTFETVLTITQLKNCNIAGGRFGHSIVAYENSFYIFSGLQFEIGRVEMYGDLIRYDVKTQLWSVVNTGGEKPSKRYGHSAVIYRSSMFIFGGRVLNCIGEVGNNYCLTMCNDLFEYQFEANIWTQFSKNSVPDPREGHIAAVYDYRLWIFSGLIYKNNKLNDMWTWDLSGSTNGWENVQQKGVFALQCVYNCPMVVDCNQMYILTETNGIHLFVFNFSKKEWSKLKDPPTNKRPYAMGIFDHQLVVFGQSIEVLYCYDLDSHTWTNIPEDSESVVRLPISEYQTVLFDGALYAFGGKLKDSCSTALYKIELKRTYPACSIHEDYEKILETGLFTDIEFVVGENEIKIPAHSAIVAARSEWFRARIRDKSYKIAEVLPEVFEMMLKYIYTDRLDSRKGSLLLYLDLYSLAAEISLKKLEELIIKQLSDEFLKKSITSSNVLSVLSRAHNIGLLVIKECCLNFVINGVDGKNVVQSAEFETLDNDLLVEIIRKKMNPVSSEILSSCENSDSNHSNLAQDMELFLNSVGEEFSDITLLVGEYSIPAHKCVLAARSSYFEAMFRSFMPPDKIIHIKIGEIIPSKEVVDVLLKYIYYDELNIPLEHSFILYFAADFYGFTNNHLQRTITTNVKRNGTFEQIVNMLEEADLAQQTDLKIFLLKLIVERYPDISSWPETHKVTLLTQVTRVMV